MRVQNRVDASIAKVGSCMVDQKCAEILTAAELGKKRVLERWWTEGWNTPIATLLQSGLGNILR